MVKKETNRLLKGEGRPVILENLKNDVVLGDGDAIFELERRGYVSAGPFTPQAIVEPPASVRQL